MPPGPVHTGPASRGAADPAASGSSPLKRRPHDAYLRTRGIVDCPDSCSPHVMSVVVMILVGVAGPAIAAETPMSMVANRLKVVRSDETGSCSPVGRNRPALVSVSKDDGETWSEPRAMIDEIPLVGRGDRSRRVAPGASQRARSRGRAPRLPRSVRDPEPRRVAAAGPRSRRRGSDLRPAQLPPRPNGSGAGLPGRVPAVCSLGRRRSNRAYRVSPELLADLERRAHHPPFPNSDLRRRAGGEGSWRRRSRPSAARWSLRILKGYIVEAISHRRPGVRAAVVEPRAVDR